MKPSKKEEEKTITKNHCTHEKQDRSVNTFFVHSHGKTKIGVSTHSLPEATEKQDGNLNTSLRK